MGCHQSSCACKGRRLNTFGNIVYFQIRRELLLFCLGVAVFPSARCSPQLCSWPFLFFVLYREIGCWCIFKNVTVNSKYWNLFKNLLLVSSKPALLSPSCPLLHTHTLESLSPGVLQGLVVGHLSFCVVIDRGAG